MMNLRAFCNALAPKYWRELARLFRNHKWERNDDGEILISHATIGGVFECEAPDGLGVVRTNNLITTEGCNYLLRIGIGGGTQEGTFYVAPFSGNVAVTDTLTHGDALGGNAYFAYIQTELTTQYTETTRVTFVESTPAAKSCNNTANPATFTAATDGVSIYGLGLMSISTKYSSSTTEICLAAAKYSTPRTLATAGDTIGVKYTVTLANSA